jgi:hypothetical protein
MEKKKPTKVERASNAEANDLLETAEVIRGSATFLRMTVGIVALSSNLCKAEVFDQNHLDDINKAYNVLFDNFSILYASLMGRYSALSASDSVGSPKNVPTKN